MSLSTLVDPDLLAAASNPSPKPRRLNLASGNHPSGSWGWDVDLNFAADVQADILHLPFPDRTFTAAYGGHVLEHIPWGAIPAVLGEVRRVLVPGAEVVAVGPCIHRAIQTAQPSWLIDAILCDPRTTEPPGIHHAWTPTEELTVEAMTRGGFIDVEVLNVADVRRPDWPNPAPDAAWQCAVRARCP